MRPLIAACRIVVLTAVALSAACDDHVPTTPTAIAPSPPPPAANRPRIFPPPMTFEVRGKVTDEAGRPVAGATVGIWVDYVVSPSVQTDDGGGYSFSLTGIRGAGYYPDIDPAGVEDSVAFLVVEAKGFEAYARHVLGTAERLIENIRLQPVRRITAGESILITMESDATVCVLDAWPGREVQCGRLSVALPRDGLLTVRATPSPPGGDLPTLEVSGFRAGARGNPASVPVGAGTESRVSIQLPWGFSGSRSFIVTTSLETARVQG